MKLSIVFVCFLCIGLTAAANYITKIYHEPTFGHYQCAGPSNRATYHLENACIGFQSFGLIHQCLGNTVLVSNFSSATCQGNPISQVNMTGCTTTPGDPLATYYGCVDEAFLAPSKFPAIGTFLEHDWQNVGCNGSLLTVEYRRLNTCYQVGINTYGYHECTADGQHIQGYHCTSSDCELTSSTCNPLPPLPDGCEAGASTEYLFTTEACTGTPPPPAMNGTATYIVTQTIAPQFTTCDPRWLVPWIDGAQQGSCVWDDHLGMEVNKCPSTGTPDMNWTATGYLDGQCTFANSLSSNVMGCINGSQTSHATNTFCSKLPNVVYNHSQYFFQSTYPGFDASVEPVSFHGTIMGVCHQSRHGDGSFINTCGNNSIIQTHCNDTDCSVGCQANQPPLWITDYTQIDMWGRNSRVHTDYCTPYVNPAPQPARSTSYMLTQIYTDPSCGTLPTYVESRLAEQCNSAAANFFQMVSYTQYNSNTQQFSTTTYADQACTRPLFTVPDQANCVSSRHMPGLYMTVTANPRAMVSWMAYNATYPSETCDASPGVYADSVMSFQAGVCTGFFGHFATATCNSDNSVMTVMWCTDPACTQQCTVDQFPAGQCFPSGVPGRSYKLGCPSSAPPQTSTSTSGRGGSSGWAHGGGDFQDERHEAHEAEVAIISVVTVICAIIAGVLAFLGYRKLRTGGYSEL